jgi:hypothetical protein
MFYLIMNTFNFQIAISTASETNKVKLNIV